MAQEAVVTTDNLREAQLASHMASYPTALPEPSVYFQDFTFGASMFEALRGNAEALSGIGSAIGDVALENRMKLEEKERKESDPAGDASMITELAAKQREEMIRVGRLSVSRAELIAFSNAMKTPEFKARFRQELRDQGVPEDQIEGRMDRAEELAELAVKVNDGTATAAEQARFDVLEADDEVVADLDTALSLPLENNLSVNATPPQEIQNASVDAQQDAPSSGAMEFLAMMESDASVTASPDREGPVITANYNSNASSETVPAARKSDSTPATAPAFSLDA